MKRAHSLLPIGLSIGALVLAGCGSDDASVSLENSWARTSAAGQTTGAVYFELTVDQDDTLLGASVPASIAADAQVHEVVMADMDAGDMDSGEMGDMDSDDMDGSGDMAGSDDMDVMADMDCEELRAEHMANSEEHMDDMDADEMADMGDVAEMSCDELLTEHEQHMGDMDMEDMGGMDMGAMTMQELTEGLALTADETVTFEPGGYHVMLLDLAEPLDVGDEVEVTLEFAEAGEYTTTVEVAESAP